MDIEKELCPKVGMLQITKGDEFDRYSAQILDEELDVINCDFEGDGTVTIDVENYSYITLSIDQLKTLVKLIKKADKLAE